MSSLNDFNNGKTPSSNTKGHPRTYIDPQAPVDKKVSTIRIALKNIDYKNTDALYNPNKIDLKGLS